MLNIMYKYEKVEIKQKDADYRFTYALVNLVLIIKKYCYKSETVPNEFYRSTNEFRISIKFDKNGYKFKLECIDPIYKFFEFHISLDKEYGFKAELLIPLTVDIETIQRMIKKLANIFKLICLFGLKATKSDVFLIRRLLIEMSETVCDIYNNNFYGRKKIEENIISRNDQVLLLSKTIKALYKDNSYKLKQDYNYKDPYIGL